MKYKNKISRRNIKKENQYETKNRSGINDNNKNDK